MPNNAVSQTIRERPSRVALYSNEFSDRAAVWQCLSEIRQTAGKGLDFFWPLNLRPRFEPKF